MPLSSESQALIAKLNALHERAASGDQEVLNRIKSLKTQALSGDEQARRTYNTLAVIHWRKQKGGDYQKAEAFYERLRAKEPAAMAKLDTLIQRVRQGDPESQTLFSVIKSIHHKFKSSAFTDGPGAPRVGGYGLPEEHRPGIIIGAETITQRHGGAFPMNHARMSGTVRVPNPRFSGVADAQPLTQTALVSLLALIQRVRAMPFTATSATSSINPMTTAVFNPALAASQAAAQQAALTASSPKVATANDIQALKNTLATNQLKASQGQLIANSNPMVANLRNGQPEWSSDPDWLYGFDVGTATAMGNSLPGPGLANIRNSLITDIMAQGQMVATPEQNDRITARLKGFDLASSAQFQMTKAGQKLVLPNVVSSLDFTKKASTLTDAQDQAAKQAAMDNQSVCNTAKTALDRQSPAYAGLAATCIAARRANIMAGRYLPDNMTPNDPAYRVALTDAGNVVIAAHPQLGQARAALPTADRQRGFTMAMGVRAGKMDPGFPAFVRPGLAPSPELLAGFDLGMSMS